MNPQRNTFIAILACVLGNFTLLAQDFEKTLLNWDFEPNTSQSEGMKKFLSHKLVSVIEGGGWRESNGLRVTYEGYENGSKRVVYHESLNGAYLSATLNFRVYFEKDFDFVRGGKLHGFGPIAPITGGRQITDTGWSVRAMFGKEGMLKPYIYHQNMKGKYGEGKPSETFRFEKERWYDLAYYLQLNSPATEANGFVEYYVDGEFLMRTENLQLYKKTGDESLINKFQISTFHGGNNEKWAPKNEDGTFKKVYAVFDDFLVKEGKYVRAQERK